MHSIVARGYGGKLLFKLVLGAWNLIKLVRGVKGSIICLFVRAVRD